MVSFANSLWTVRIPRQELDSIVIFLNAARYAGTRAIKTFVFGIEGIHEEKVFPKVRLGRTTTC